MIDTSSFVIGVSSITASVNDRHYHPAPANTLRRRHDMTPVHIFGRPEGVSRRRKRSSHRHSRPINPDLSDRRARRGQERLALATVLAAAVVFYDGMQIHIDGHPSGLQLASALAVAMLAQGWTTSRSSASTRWFFVALLAVAGVLSFAGFTLFAWAVDGSLLMLPLSLVLAAIASWVAGSSHVRALGHERAAQRARRIPRAARITAGVLGGLLLIQGGAFLVGYSRVTSALVFSLILIAIAIPPLYLAMERKDLRLWRDTAR
jgi:hypothetical protein